MARPRSPTNWMDQRRRARIKQRLLALGARARSAQVTLFLDGSRLLAVSQSNTRYKQQRIEYLEQTCTLIGVYGPRVRDAYSRMIEDCEAAGVFK
jgi:hypothetical protein